MSLKRTAGPLTLLASYTFGKSMDWASSIQEQVNPFNFRKEYAISAFDLKHNFVISYNYELPFDKLFRASNRLTKGWAVSGVSRFSTGLPVTFQSFGDNALVQVQNNGVNSVSIDLPNYNPSLGSLGINHNPRNNPLAFNTKLFSPNALGTFGTSSPASSTARGSTTTIWRFVRPLDSRNPAPWNSVSKPSTLSTMRSSTVQERSTATATAPPSGKF